LKRKQGVGSFVKPKLNGLITDPLLIFTVQIAQRNAILICWNFVTRLKAWPPITPALRGQPDDYTA